MRKKTPRESSMESCAPGKLSFEFSHCAIFGGGPCIEWNGKKSELRWRDAYDNTWHPLPTPSDLQWKAFWLLLDQSGVRNWESEYSNEGVMDGTVWEFKLTDPGLRIATAGNNAYPGSDSLVPIPGSPFDILTTAIGILAGYDVHDLKAPPGSRNDCQIAPDSEIDSAGSDADPLV